MSWPTDVIIDRCTVNRQISPTISLTSSVKETILFYKAYGEYYVFILSVNGSHFNYQPVFIYSDNPKLILVDSLIFTISNL